MQKMTFDVLRSFDSTTFTGSYQNLGTPLTYAASIIKLVNNSTVLVTVSIDGTNAFDILPTLSYTVYDQTTNHAIDYTFMAKGTQFMVSGSAGTGSVYLVCQYILPNSSITGL